MMNLNLRYPPQPQKLSHREILDLLVSTGYRPYVCGDTGYGVVIAWATSVYKEEDLSGEPGFMPERWCGQDIPTTGLVPDVDASLQRVAKALDCENVQQRPIEPSLEHLISSSVMIIGPDDWGKVLVKPLIPPVGRKY